MAYLRILILSTVLLFINNNGFAQDEEVKMKNLSNGSIEEQFDYIIKKSNRYQEYKVVKRTWLDQLKSHVSDSLNVVRKELKESHSLIEEQETEITSLKEELGNTNNSLTKVNSEKDRISFFGIPMKKATYKSIMWAIVAALGGLLFIFIGRFARSKSVTAQAKKSHSEVMQEFDAYKNKAMESEQKLRRKLQDEVNKRL